MARAAIGYAAAMSTAPLTGVRAAILRSLLVGIAACALAALVAGFLPGRMWVTEVVDRSGVHEVVDREAAGGPLLKLTVLAMLGVAALGVVVPRREVTAFAAGVLTVLAIPLLAWLGFSRLDGQAGGPPLLAARHVLATCVGTLVVAGPLLATVGAVLFGLERRVAATPVPAARAR